MSGGAGLLPPRIDRQQSEARPLAVQVEVNPAREGSASRSTRFALDEKGLGIADSRVDHGRDGVGVSHLSQARLHGRSPLAAEKRSPSRASLKPRQG